MPEPGQPKMLSGDERSARAGGARVQMSPASRTATMLALLLKQRPAVRRVGAGDRWHPRRRGAQTQVRRPLASETVRRIIAAPVGAEVCPERKEDLM